MTCLPADVTLISLPPGPLLELTCVAAQRRLSGVWLSLTGMLLAQLDPPSLTTLSLGPRPESQSLVLTVLPILLEPCFHILNSTEAMETVSTLHLIPFISTNSSALGQNPDIAQAFFNCMETVNTTLPTFLKSRLIPLVQVAQHFTLAIYQLPGPIFTTLIQTAIGAFVIQERYALVAACMFLVRVPFFALVFWRLCRITDQSYPQHDGRWESD